jgi:hypothetical protein
LSNSGVDRSSWSHAHVYIWSTLFIHNTLTNWHRTIHANCSCSINGFIYSTTVNESIMDTFFVLFILFLVLHSFIDSFVRSLVRTVFERFTYWHSIVYNWFRQNNRMRTNWKSWQNTADEMSFLFSLSTVCVCLLSKYSLETNAVIDRWIDDSKKSFYEKRRREQYNERNNNAQSQFRSYSTTT